MQGNGGNVKKTFIDQLKLLKNGASGAMGNSAMGGSGSSGSNNNMQNTKKEDINYLSIFSITDETSRGGASNSANHKLKQH